MGIMCYSKEEFFVRKLNRIEEKPEMNTAIIFARYYAITQIALSKDN